LNGDPNKPGWDEGVSAPEDTIEPPPVQSGLQQNLQRVLVASLIGAIILMIAIGAFWTSF
jgi:hypothetical protein